MSAHTLVVMLPDSEPGDIKIDCDLHSSSAEERRQDATRQDGRIEASDGDAESVWMDVIECQEASASVARGRSAVKAAKPSRASESEPQRELLGGRWMPRCFRQSFRSAVDAAKHADENQEHAEQVSRQ